MNVVVKSKGITLLEILLVLAISGVIIISGIRFYLSYRNDIYLMQVKNNVDTLFQALGNYYRANCIAYKKDSMIFSKTGTLDPINNPPPSNPFAINLADLKSSGFLLRWPFPENPFVKGADGYVAQFNLYTGNRQTPISPSGQVYVGTNYYWKAQVAVEAKDKDNAASLKNLLGADCLSSLSGGTVTPCETATGGNYLVWERLPSFGSPELGSDLWLSQPQIIQFLQLYNTYPFTSISSGLITDQYYLCGG